MAAIHATRRGRPSPEASRRMLGEVLAAARDEFSRRGYRAVTIRSVADRASVSTRTLYNHYKDKLSLFTACLDSGAAAFPHISADEAGEPAAALRRYAAELVEMLTVDSSLRISMLVYREGAEFPELVAAAEANQAKHLIAPLAAFLSAAGIGGDDPREHARLFTTLATSQWQHSAVFGHPMPARSEIERHAALIVRIFLDGARPASGSKARTG